MKLESAVVKVRRMRIATSVGAAIALISLGVLSKSDSLPESIQDNLIWLAAIFIILSVVVPVSYTIYIAKKGPSVPEDDDEE